LKLFKRNKFLIYKPTGWSEEEILKNYPQLKKDDILAAIEYSLKLGGKHDKKSKMDS